MGYKMTTINGYDYYEVMSAFQKSIRRGIEDETVFWGIELYESNFEPHLWNRLFIIAHEDIGIADPTIVSRLLDHKFIHDHLKKSRPKRVSKKLVMLQIFIMFANAKKSRYTDLAYSVYWAKHDQMAQDKPIPDFALDMHTKRGKRLGRGLEHFYESSALTNNTSKHPNELEFEQLARQIDMETDNLTDIPVPEKSTNTEQTDADPNLFS
jgi:replication-associated recombination protein RarA